MRLWDLHVHSRKSDGDQTPREVVIAAAQRGVVGVSLTDHNGLWGTPEAREAADMHGLQYVEGIEVSTLWQQRDVHVLGYSRQFLRPVLHEGLAATRAGARERVQSMIERCHALGFTNVTWEAVLAYREHQVDPSFGSYDVARLLKEEHGLTTQEALQLTVQGGQCHVPYGDWALSVSESIELIRASSGIAVLAHPGIIALEMGATRLWELLAELVPQGLQGLEVWHPLNPPALIRELKAFAQKHTLVMTGGSDWHGMGRYDDTALGRVGMLQDAWEQFQGAL